MKKYILIICLLIVSLAAAAQKKVVMPDCATENSISLFNSYPCKVPHYVKDRIAYYTVRDFKLNALGGSISDYIKLTSDFSISSAFTSWMIFSYANKPKWYIDNPEKTEGYVLHIKRSQLTWLNDSTAIYK